MNDSQLDKQNDDNHHSIVSQTPRWELLGLFAFIFLLIAPFLYYYRIIDGAVESTESPPAFTGSESCRECHKAAYDKWLGSDHQMAMAEATETTVFGNFNDTTFHDPYSGVTSRFFKEGEVFKVETEGPDGTLGIFSISHTFGFYPLQQYLVPFPDGRFQCLPIAWDVDKKQWYRLPPYDIKDHEDWLHWTKGGQNWNSMCAECHSTRLQKNYDSATNSYKTKWEEISVGCEACHGPASQHLEWAKIPPLARPQVENYGLPIASQDILPEKQIAMCAPCHSRRYQLGDNDHLATETLDLLVPSLLNENLYHTDGQIKEEVYVYGSFTQSKMYLRGVKCSDCHDVHSLNTVLKVDGSNDLCLQCHPKSEYDTKNHHFHKTVHEGKPSPGHLCVKCHMPGQYYMGIDYRPDHSLRVPRPDLSEKLGTPNSCSTSDCHGDKPIAWVLEYYTKWYGESRKTHYGEVLALGRSSAPEGGDQLRALVRDSLQPAIVRATALQLLQNYPGQKTLQVFRTMLSSEHPVLRLTALRTLTNPDRETILKFIVPKLYDPVKAVRLEAALNLVRLPKSMIKEQDRDTLSRTIAEYRQAMGYNGDFAPQRYNLGNLERNLGNSEQAIRFYREALEIDGEFVPAKVNLAMEYNRSGKNELAEQLFKEVVVSHPELHEISYSLGLLLAEMQKFDEAAKYLARAAENIPGNTRIRFNLALILLKLNRWQESAFILEQLLDSGEISEDYFVTLINIYLQHGATVSARLAAEKVLSANPGFTPAKEALQFMSRN